MAISEELTDQQYKQFNFFTTSEGANYEPKTKNRFILRLTNVPTVPFKPFSIFPGDKNALNSYLQEESRKTLLLSVSTFSRPSYGVSEIEIPNFNEPIYMAGKPSQSREISCDFMDYIGTKNTHARDVFEASYDAVNTTSSIIYKWFSLVNNPDFGTVGYKDYYTVEADLYILAPTGQYVEHWRYYTLWPKTVEFGDVGYDSSEFLTINVSFQYDRARLISEKSRESINSNNGKSNYLYYGLSNGSEYDPNKEEVNDAGPILRENARIAREGNVTDNNPGLGNALSIFNDDKNRSIGTDLDSQITSSGDYGSYKDKNNKDIVISTFFPKDTKGDIIETEVVDGRTVATGETTTNYSENYTGSNQVARTDKSGGFNSEENSSNNLDEASIVSGDSNYNFSLDSQNVKSGE